MFCEISGPLSHAAYTERSTSVDLLIKIPGSLNPAAYWKVYNFFKRSEICLKKRSKISNAPLWKFDKNIPGTSPGQSECICLDSSFKLPWSTYFHCVCSKRNWKSYIAFSEFLVDPALCAAESLIRKSIKNVHESYSLMWHRHGKEQFFYNSYHNSESK